MAGVTVEGAVIPQDATVASRPDLFGTRGQFRPDGKGGLITYMNAGDKPEFATPEASGVESGFYVKDRGLPWHVTLARQLGSRELMEGQDRLLTLDEALVATGGNFDVVLRDVMTDTGILIPGAKASVREDTGAPLAVVGRIYTPYSNRTLGELADKIVQQRDGDGYVAAYETGGVTGGGRGFFLSMELNHLDIPVPGDPSGVLKTYLLLTTRHDGQGPARFDITQVRGVCTNTVKLAKAKASHTLSIRHRGSLEGKLAEAQRVLGIAVRESVAATEIVDRLALTKVVDAQIRDIFDKVWPLETPAEGEHSRSAVKAFEVYEESPNLDGIRGTAWGALNAVTEYLDHFAQFRGGEVSDPSERRMESLLFGRAAKQKDEALGLLLKAGK